MHFLRQMKCMDLLEGHNKCALRRSACVLHRHSLRRWWSSPLWVIAAEKFWKFSPTTRASYENFLVCLGIYQGKKIPNGLWGTRTRKVSVVPCRDSVVVKSGGHWMTITRCWLCCRRREGLVSCFQMSVNQLELFVKGTWSWSKSFIAAKVLQQNVISKYGIFRNDQWTKADIVQPIRSYSHVTGNSSGKAAVAQVLSATNFKLCPVWCLHLKWELRQQFAEEMSVGLFPKSVDFVCFNIFWQKRPIFLDRCFLTFSCRSSWTSRSVDIHQKLIPGHVVVRGAQSRLGAQRDSEFHQVSSR